ncbi:MAG TPA: hypothetical protein DFS52_08685, partial [Myxococcales bacterium]|nr:hypothetical protein [Myxococcales bacterium]
MKKLIPAAALCLALAIGLAPGNAAANAFPEHGGLLDRSSQERSPMLSVWGFVPYYYGMGVGAGVRYAIPIASQGFIRALNDSVELEFGGDFSYFRT